MNATRSLLILWLPLVAVRAAPAPAPSDRQLRFCLQEEEFPEMGRMKTGLLDVDYRSYWFVPLPNWTITANPQKRTLFLKSPDYARIHVRFPEAKDDSPPTCSAEALREYITATYPGTRFVAEATAHASSSAGPMFEFKWKTDAGVWFASRIAWVKMNHRLVEFGLTADAESLGPHRTDFAALMTSFQPASAGQ